MPAGRKNPHRSLRQIYSLLKKRYGPQNWWPAKTPFEVVVGALLTQNTSWKNVEKAIGNLRKEGLLSFNKIRKVHPKLLGRIIRPAGYFNVKARRLKNLIAFLDQECGGKLNGFFKEEVRGLRSKLLSVNGVGPETADSILLYAAYKPIFVIDAYTKRIFSRLGFTAPHADYETLQRFFMGHLPRRRGLYNEYHALIVEHAKTTCQPRPKCGHCPLNGMCHYHQQFSAKGTKT